MMNPNHAALWSTPYNDRDNMSLLSICCQLCLVNSVTDSNPLKIDVFVNIHTKYLNHFSATCAY